MAEIKLTYFDLRVKGEPCRLLLAYAGLKYTDERITCPWDNPATWDTMKPTTRWGQMPCLDWNGTVVCQSMAICRFLARECGLAGKTSLEMAQVDEVVDVVQDALTAVYNAWYTAKFAKNNDPLVVLTEKTFPNTLDMLEKCLKERGGQFMVGSSYTWADIHLFFLCSEDFLDEKVLGDYPLVQNLVKRVGALPNIQQWMKTRPENGKEDPGAKIYFRNAWRILEDTE